MKVRRNIYNMHTSTYGWRVASDGAASAAPLRLVRTYRRV